MRTRIFASRCQSLVVTVAKVVSLVWLLSCLLSAQPQIYEGGIVNAASYGMGERERNHVAPGSIAAIFGKRLADVTLQAKGVPLPFELGGSG